MTLSQAPGSDGGATGDDPAVVTLYWRPGCPYCTMLRWELRGDGLDVQEVNIWADPQAAARVRQITGGDETVPTVVVGRHAMVNPSAAQVYAAAGLEPVTARDGGSRRPWAAGLASVAFAVFWIVSALAHPTATFHLGPALVVAATPVARRLSEGPLPPAAAIAATGFALAASALTTASLTALNALRGPVLIGNGPALAETILIGVLTAIVTLWAITRSRPTAHR